MPDSGMESLLSDDTPTGVHDSVSPTNESVAQFESAVSSHMDQSPVVEHQEDALTMNSATSEPFSQPVED
ncbi:MAG: hypothetical protein Q4B28_05380 [bacterium]|nr:hypothetical protein [bacterium]